MYKKKISISLLVGLLLICSAIPMITKATAEEDPIEGAIEAGITWLVNQQLEDGSWSVSPYFTIGETGFALIKLQDRAFELGKDPFDPSYAYYDSVMAGWNYLFTTAMDLEYIPPQPAGDPDSNGNGYGICFRQVVDNTRTVYETGICLMALVASGIPFRENSFGIDYDEDGSPDTFGEIAQEAVDYLAFSQVDIEPRRGSWGYKPNAEGDNSVAGYAVLGLAAGESFGCIVPQWVKDELSIWIDMIQNDPGPQDDAFFWYYDIVGHPWGGYWEPEPDGGSGYWPSVTPEVNYIWWVSQLKTGNLMFQMAFCGDTPAEPRFQNALDYIERHWHDTNYQPGWGYGQPGPKIYQAMYCLMKGLEYSNIDLIDIDDDGTPEHDWYQEFAQVLISEQQSDGSWLSSPCFAWYYPPYPLGTQSGPILSTVWALFILEKVLPESIMPVSIDIKPGSWPNPINLNSRGLIPIAICGTEDFDVTTIDPTSVQLYNEPIEEGVSPLHWSYEDTATPYIGEDFGGHALGGDGYTDLVMHFDTQEVITILGLSGYLEDIETLTIKGNLKEQHGGSIIFGQDYVLIIEANFELKPFIIDDNGGGDFTWEEASEKPWCKGVGTANNPYIIENIIIEGKGADECLVIRNSEAFFIIRGSRFYNSEIAALVVENAVNGKIFNNTCSNNANTGIGIRNSNSIEVLENICMDNAWGIVLTGWGGVTYDTLVERNICIKNSEGGILLWENVEYNTVNENNCSKNLWGILLWIDTFNNIISDNICMENTESGILVGINSNENIISENMCSKNYGSGIVLVTNVNYNYVTDNNCFQNGGVGIYLNNSANWNIISYNTVTENTWGIGIDWDPIGLPTCYYNEIHHNIIMYNYLLDWFDAGIGTWWHDNIPGP